ncbi:MAG: hypothetical protein IPL49_04925 [Saprospirales bacterium]|nr:hypothetical protein [Saprospirales bacterium]MBK8490254.1 hypothetical protein [Saprospirales bacterium]
MRWIFLVSFITLMQTAMSAQNEKVIHQAFDLAGIDNLSLDLIGEVEIEFWAGDNALSETKIQIWDAPPHVLKFFVEEKKRYEILEARNGTGMVLSANDPLRDPIRYKETACFETVKLRLFVPDSFDKVGAGVYQRRK